MPQKVRIQGRPSGAINDPIEDAYVTGNALDVNIAGHTDDRDSEILIPVSGTLSSGTPGALVYESGDISPYDLFTFESTVASVQVFGKTSSSDSYGANALALIDLHSTTPATRVTSTAVDKKYQLVCTGFYQIKVVEGAGGAANIVGAFSNGVPSA